MQTVNGQNEKKGCFGSLLSDVTPAKASGLAFSTATVLPVVFSFVFLFVVSLCGLTAEGYENEDWYLYFGYLLPQLGFAVVAWLYLIYRGTPVKTALLKQKCRPKYFLVALALQIGLLCLSELNVWFLELLGKFGYTDTGIALPSMDGFGFVGVLLVVGVFPAIFEEIIFRGAVLDGLKKTFSVPVAVLLCGALFSLYHQNPAQTLYQFCCGAAFALVAIRSGSILPTVLSHFLNNAFIVVLYKLGVESFSTPVFAVVMSVSALCLVGSLVYLIFFDKQTPTEKTKGEGKRFFLFAAVGIAICALTWFSVLLMGM
ncbi:MAG: CPBP family intramembrane metalloprotease [Clostridia bacterium]|nr:CPBP family intramembrane metalloprotease [Clostridia bacterium]